MMLYSLLFSAIFWIIFALVREFGSTPHTDTTTINTLQTSQQINNSSDDQLIQTTQHMGELLQGLE